MIIRRGWCAPLLRPTDTEDDSIRLKLHNHSSLKWSRCHKGTTVLINFERMSTASLQHTSYSYSYSYIWISLRYSTQSVETDGGKSWASLAAPQIHHYRSPVPWGHACPSPWWWWTVRFFPSLQRCKQGCILAPTVLSLMSSAMLKGAFRDCDAGIRINHRSGHRLPKASDSKTASRSL